MGSSGGVSSIRELPRLLGWLESTERPSASPQKRAAPSKSEVRQSISTAQRREWCMSVPSDKRSSFSSIHHTPRRSRAELILSLDDLVDLKRKPRIARPCSFDGGAVDYGGDETGFP